MCLAFKSRVQQFGPFAPQLGRGKTILQHLAVGPACRANYVSLMKIWEDYVGSSGLLWDPGDYNTIDSYLADIMDMLFLDGEEYAKGTSLKAAFEDSYPAYGRFGTLRLPRTARALQGWRKCRPVLRAHRCRGFLQHSSLPTWPIPGLSLKQCAWPYCFGHIWGRAKLSNFLGPTSSLPLLLQHTTPFCFIHRSVAPPAR